MTSGHIKLSVIRGIVNGARRFLGEDAAKIANSVEGLEVMAHGGIVITRDAVKITNELIKAYGDAVKGKIYVDVEVTVNVEGSGNRNNN